MALTGVRIKGDDDVTIKLLDPNSGVVFYYGDGRYEEMAAAIRKQCPKAVLVPIAVRADFVIKGAKRLFLDVEPGDAANNQAVSWYHLAKEAEVEIPGFYTSVSNAQALIDVLSAAGLRYGVDYVLWTAHYTGVAHLCGPDCGFGFRETAYVTQYTDQLENKSLDGDYATPYGIGLVIPEPKPTNNYGWYPNFKLKQLDGKTEREVVEAYDKARARITHYEPGEGSLHELRQLCNAAAVRISTLVEHEGKASATHFHRSWRKELLLRRANGDKVAV